MFISPKLKIIIFALVAIAIGIGVGWYASRPKTLETQTLTVNDSGIENTEKAAASSGGASDSSRLPDYKKSAARAERTASETAGAFGSAAATASGSATNEIIPDWDEKISDIILSDSDFSNKCVEMLKMFPHLPESGQVETAHHLSNFTQDENYAPLGKVLIDPKISTNVAEVLMTDVLNRGNRVKLPVLLQVARTPNHPSAAEAKDFLERFLEEDLGTDWSRWEQKIQTYLKENPD